MIFYFWVHVNITLSAIFIMMKCSLGHWYSSSVFLYQLRQHVKFTCNHLHAILAATILNIATSKLQCLWKLFHIYTLSKAIFTSTATLTDLMYVITSLIVITLISYFLFGCNCSVGRFRQKNRFHKCKWCQLERGIPRWIWAI